MKSPIPVYPASAPIDISMRGLLHPSFKALAPAISEFTFANLYLFRRTHAYSVASFPGGGIVISGEDRGEKFFMLPFGLPGREALEDLFGRHSSMKCVAESQVAPLEALGCRVTEDPDNFDYLYSRAEMSHLSGRKFHRKKNLVSFFTWRYEHGEEPLTQGRISDADAVLEAWYESRQDGHRDYEAAKEALALCEPLQLCGSIYYVEGAPAAYILGEELNPSTFVIHFEKALPGIKGLLQYANMHFSTLLPARYELVNREQDLGEDGLRKAKESWRPVGRVRKLRARKVIETA